jgi:hypothetical protein
MSAWDGLSLDVIREAAEDPSKNLLLTLGTNLFGGQKMVYVETIDPLNPRRKPVRVVPGPLLPPDGEGWPSLLRMLADIIEGTVECPPIDAKAVGS